MRNQAIEKLLGSQMGPTPAGMYNYLTQMRVPGGVFAKRKHDVLTNNKNVRGNDRKTGT